MREIAFAIVVSALILAAALVIDDEPPPARYAIAPASGGDSQGGLAYRLDTKTGAVMACAMTECAPVVMRTKPFQ